MYSRIRELTQKERASRWLGTPLVHRWAVEVRVFVQSASKEVVVAFMCLNTSRLYPLLFHVTRRMGG